MQKVLNKFEKLTGYVLIIAVMVYITFQTLVLVWESVRSYTERIRQVGLDYTQQYGSTVFIVFFNILLALEVLETVRVSEKDHVQKIRIILLVCIIAVSRKIFALDLHNGNPMTEFAVAILIVGLSLSYFMVNRTHNGIKQTSDL